MWVGKLIAGAIGFAVAGYIGAAVGLLIGHFFDSGLAKLSESLSPEKRAEVERLFFATVFTLLGKLAKADGRVSEDEIRHAEAVMGQLRLTPDHRKEAINLFKVGSAPGYNPDSLLKSFEEATAFSPQLKQMLLIYLIGMAMADGRLDDAELKVLKDCADAMGIPYRALQHLIAMAQAQDHFRSSSSQTGSTTENDLATAYSALGIQPSATDAELKKAYRKLMSEFHPDKLMGQGVPEDMIQLATERSQEIQAAYELIKRSRKAN